MRIAMLASAASIHTRRWASALAQRGYDIHLLSCHPAPSPPPDGVTLHALPFGRPHGYFLNALAVRSLLAKLSPAVLHAHFASGYGTLGRCAGFRPYLISVWGSDVYMFPQGSAFKRSLLHANLASADWICSTSRAMAAETRRLCPQLRGLTITPFGIDTSVFAPSTETRDDDRIVIGTVKTLDPNYGVDTLLEGFALCRRQLAKTRPELAKRLRLQIVGGGPMLAAYQQLAQQLQIADVAEFVGQVPYTDVPRRLNSLDVYVAVSRSESFGVAVVEASACERPVVVSDVGGLPEVVADGETGLIVPPDNPPALAQALERLATDETLRKRFGEAGRQLVQREYEWSENVTLMERVYQQLEAARRAAA